jgi:hypothetical protein
MKRGRGITWKVILGVLVVAVGDVFEDWGLGGFVDWIADVGWFLGCCYGNVEGFDVSGGIWLVIPSLAVISEFLISVSSGFCNSYLWSKKAVISR